MQVVHDPDGDRRVLATDVDIAESFEAQTKGLMGRSSVPDDYALVFYFEEPDFIYRTFVQPLTGKLPRQYIHMLFVRTPLDVLWLRDDEVIKSKTLSPWTGLGAGRADIIIELAAGSADDVAVGDTVVIEKETD